MSRANASIHPTSDVFDGAGMCLVAGSNGLTIREEFAKTAMQGLLSHPHTDANPSAVATDAVAYADALIAELAKPTQPDRQIVEAREIISNLKAMVQQVPELNNHKYVSFGIRLNKFLDDTKHLVQP